MSATKYRRTGLEEFLGGLGIFAVCVVLVALHVLNGWIMIVGVILGALPMVRGLKRLGRDRENRQLFADRVVEDQSLSTQRAILQLASRNGGVVTPAMVVLSANVSLENVDRALQDMAAKGYAEMNIRSNGIIEYVITEFRA